MYNCLYSFLFHYFVYVLDNINAIKHTDTKIVITVDKGVSVYNEGKTIEEERIESIWYTFVTHDKSGTGLGLAICRSILELHDYKYGVINRDNGVEFYFYE
ncbi:MAG: ATP-binding protein [Bacilli bacterium]|nr:ATP-binding protein [Bacilli bacterium]